MTEALRHQPVLLKEVIEGLAIKPDGIYIDATFGRGGHSQAILEQLNEAGKLLVIDKDTDAISVAESRFAHDRRVMIHQGSFTQITQWAKQHGIFGKANGILLDLGVSSPQLDDAQRGFSFLKDGPLDMRMDTTTGISAADWINAADASEIADVLKEFGEERFAKRIAGFIVESRNHAPIQTTSQLAEIVSKANPRWEKHKHPATRAFQAIRIFINRELTELQHCLEQILDVLSIGGRLAVISFHSLEDRQVKQFIRRHCQGDKWPAGVPVTYQELNLRLRKIGRAIQPHEDEVKANPRSRSATLRIAEKLT